MGRSWIRLNHLKTIRLNQQHQDKMYIFVDRISGDELFTDTFKYTITTEENPGAVGPGMYRVECKITTEKDEDNFDIGANASAEDGAEATDTVAASGLDCALASKLVKTEMSKVGYKGAIKEYMKALKENLEKQKPEVVDKFVSNAKKVVGTVIGNKKFSDYEFYTGSSMDPNGMIVICVWRNQKAETKYHAYISLRKGLLRKKC